MSERRKDGIHFNHLCVDRRGAIKLGEGEAVLAAVGHRFLNMPAQAEERVSSFGAYKGYSSEAYDGWKRTSQYVAVRDSTRLAMDIFRSFGTTTELSNPLDAQGGYAITERLAKQPRSTGNIGMFGVSHEGEIPLRIAGTAPLPPSSWMTSRPTTPITRACRAPTTY